MLTRVLCKLEVWQWCSTAPALGLNRSGAQLREMRLNQSYRAGVCWSSSFLLIDGTFANLGGELRSLKVSHKSVNSKLAETDLSVMYSESTQPDLLHSSRFWSLKTSRGTKAHSHTFTKNHGSMLLCLLLVYMEQGDVTYCLEDTRLEKNVNGILQVEFHNRVRLRWEASCLRPQF